LSLARSGSRDIIDSFLAAANISAPEIGFEFTPKSAKMSGWLEVLHDSDEFRAKFRQYETQTSSNPTRPVRMPKVWPRIQQHWSIVSAKEKQKSSPKQPCKGQIVSHRQK